ncbi:MAG: hypothetical protein K2J80_11100 [Oscillospiraceae bacterium]|nr:hypothetical protein [Oscillospiraceae bacterium]
MISPRAADKTASASSAAHTAAFKADRSAQSVRKADIRPCIRRLLDSLKADFFYKLTLCG